MFEWILGREWNVMLKISSSRLYSNTLSFSNVN